MIIRPAAERDIAGAVDWYEDQREGLGDDFLVALDHVFDQIERMPEVHRVVYQQIRRALIPRFRYAVYYQLENGKVVVLAVVHGHRNPGFWKSRS